MGHWRRNCCKASGDGALRRKEVKIVTAQQEGGPSNPIMVGFVQPQYDFSLKLSGRTPSLEDPQRLSIVSEDYRVTNQFNEDFRVLKRKWRSWKLKINVCGA